LDIRSLVENGLQDVVSVGVADIIGHIELINKKVFYNSGGGGGEIESEWSEISREVIGIKRDTISLESSSSSGSIDGGNTDGEEGINIEDTEVPFAGINGFSCGSSGEDSRSDSVSVLDGNGKRESEAIVEGSSVDGNEFSDANISNISSQVFGTTSSERNTNISTDESSISKNSNITYGSTVIEEREFDSGSGKRSDLSTESTIGIFAGVDIEVSK
jgi:hypothetical protein